MSHFSVLVLTKTGETEEVEQLLAPYAENDEWFREGSRWDWWVIGGQWSGFLEPEYDAYTDPENHETCRLCHGTGHRDDERARELRKTDPAYSCNGCSGAGSRLKAAPDFVQRGNVASVSDLRVDRLPTPFALVTPDGTWQEKGRMGWFGAVRDDEDGSGEKGEELWRAAYKAALDQYPDAVAVVVDCHV